MKGGKKKMKKKDKDNTSVSTPELDLSIYPQEEYTTSKGEKKIRYVVPDEIAEEYKNVLPNGTVNESHTKRVMNKGLMGIFGADPEKDKEIQRAGRIGQLAVQRQRKLIREMLTGILDQEDAEGETQQFKICQAQVDRALMGDTKAFLAIRDTIGEKPAETIDLSADITTEADRALMEKLKARMIDH